jgi:hypothetical protein
LDGVGAFELLFAAPLHASACSSRARPGLRSRGFGGM